MSLFRDFIEKMRDTPDSDGSLLDHSILVYGGGLGDGNIHSFSGLPLVIAGGGAGQLRGGRHLTYPSDTPLMNAGLTLLDKVGVHLGSIGDSTGAVERSVSIPSRRASAMSCPARIGIAGVVMFTLLAAHRPAVGRAPT